MLGWFRLKSLKNAFQQDERLVVIHLSPPAVVSLY